MPGAARAAQGLKPCPRRQSKRKYTWRPGVRMRARSGVSRGGPEALPAPTIEKSEIGGEAGIRTLGTGFSPYNGLANRRLQPLGHLTAWS